MKTEITITNNNPNPETYLTEVLTPSQKFLMEHVITERIYCHLYNNNKKTCIIWVSENEPTVTGYISNTWFFPNYLDSNLKEVLTYYLTDDISDHIEFVY